MQLEIIEQWDEMVQGFAEKLAPPVNVNTLVRSELKKSRLPNQAGRLIFLTKLPVAQKGLRNSQVIHQGFDNGEAHDSLLEGIEHHVQMTRHSKTPRVHESSVVRRLINVCAQWYHRNCTLSYVFLGALLCGETSYLAPHLMESFESAAFHEVNVCCVHTFFSQDQHAPSPECSMGTIVSQSVHSNRAICENDCQTQHVVES